MRSPVLLLNVTHPDNTDAHHAGVLTTRALTNNWMRPVAAMKFHRDHRWLGRSSSSRDMVSVKEAIMGAVSRRRATSSS